VYAQNPQIEKLSKFDVKFIPEAHTNFIACKKSSYAMKIQRKKQKDKNDRCMLYTS